MLKRIILAAAIVAALLVPSLGSAEPQGRPDYCDRYPALQTAHGAYKRAQKGWNAKKVKTNRGAQKRVRIQSHCAPTKQGRKHVKLAIKKARKHYKKAEVRALYDEITSAPGQARLAVLRQCESTNRYNDPAAPAGAYGMLQGWSLAKTYYTSEMRKAFGDPPSPPYLATPEQQDILASLLYQHHGTGPWECGF